MTKNLQEKIAEIEKLAKRKADEYIYGETISTARVAAEINGKCLMAKQAWEIIEQLQTKIHNLEIKSELFRDLCKDFSRNHDELIKKINNQ